MTKLGLLATVVPFVLLVLSAYAQTQSYPARPVRIVTTETGGGSDFVSRLLAQGIAGPLGQQVIVDNRAAIIAVDTELKSNPNGHTLFLYGNVVGLASADARYAALESMPGLRARDTDQPCTQCSRRPPVGSCGFGEGTGNARPCKGRPAQLRRRCGGGIHSSCRGTH